MKARNCKCAVRVDKKLAANGAMLDLPLSTNPELSRVCIVATMKSRDTLKRYKPTTLLATYCPFCGKKYVWGPK